MKEIQWIKTRENVRCEEKGMLREARGANEGLGRRPSGNGAPASAGRPSGKSSSASVRRTSESGDPTRRTTPGGTVTPMRRESGSVRKPSEQAGRAQGSLRKEHSETGRTRDAAGAPTDPSLRRAAGKAQGNPAEQKPVRSADGIVRKQGGHPNGKSKAMSKRKRNKNGQHLILLPEECLL